VAARLEVRAVAVGVAAVGHGVDGEHAGGRRRGDVDGGVAEAPRQQLDELAGLHQRDLGGAAGRGGAVQVLGDGRFVEEPARSLRGQEGAVRRVVRELELRLDLRRVGARALGDASVFGEVDDLGATVDDGGVDDRELLAGHPDVCRVGGDDRGEGECERDGASHATFSSGAPPGGRAPGRGCPRSVPKPHDVSQRMIWLERYWALARHQGRASARGHAAASSRAGATVARVRRIE